MTELADVVRELYGLAPEEFTRTRDARANEARAAGDKELADQIKRLPKPSKAAWVVNAYVRHNADDVQRLIGLGTAIRTAHRDRDGDRLRQLDRQRHQMTTAMTTQAIELAEKLGQSSTAQISTQVGQTLQAAVADENAAAAVWSGQLTAVLAATGFEPVDPAGSVAVASLLEPPPSIAVPVPDTSESEPSARRRETSTADDALVRESRDADKAAATAAKTLERARGKVERSRSRHEQLRAELTQVRQQLRRLERDVAAEEERLAAAEGELEKAERDAAGARRAAERLRNRLTRHR